MKILCLLVGFEPNATMNTAHHMLLYGCGEPGSDNPVWYVNCDFQLFTILAQNTKLLFTLPFSQLSSFQELR